MDHKPKYKMINYNYNREHIKDNFFYFQLSKSLLKNTQKYKL